jgi:alpha-glucoside transport system permease protein
VQQGPDYVLDVIAGTVPYDDAGVKQAYETYGKWAKDPAYTVGGAEGTVSTAFLDAIYKVFSDPPEAMMVKQSGFAGAEVAKQYPDLEYGVDYDFFGVPGAQGLQGGTDNMMVFNNTPAVKAFVAYLTSEAGAKKWAEVGFDLSPNSKAVGAYTDPALSKKLSPVALARPSGRPSWTMSTMPPLWTQPWLKQLQCKQQQRSNNHVQKGAIPDGESPPISINQRDRSSSCRIERRTSMDDDRVPKIMRQGKIVPWLYVAPALLIMTAFIVYPGFNTLLLSFKNADSTQSAAAACLEGEPCWGILENFRYALTAPIMLSAFRNNLLWVILMVGGTVGMGLLIAVLADRVKYESLAKAIIFMPMAISFVGAGIIWKFVYAYGTSQVQIGLLNAIVTALGGEPVSWLSEPAVNNFALIIVGVWMWTGFCMTILSAALKGVPTEILEAARVDGANEWTVFWKIMVPIIMPTIAVVVTTMVINVLKIFDIVYVMTGGNYGTEVIANRMYGEMYISHQSGRSAAIAVILILLTVPFMIWNVRRFREQEAIR